jgi:hypothetical protein
MPYPDEERPTVDEQLTGGVCASCGQPLADAPDERAD